MTRPTLAHTIGFLSALLFTGWVLQQPPSTSPTPSHEARAVANLLLPPGP